ncbi:MAG: hypothetical protein ITG00_11320 [Flavobacterium sp.]|nr:hypothetical protein [Flavobacterium sp.]
MKNRLLFILVVTIIFSSCNNEEKRLAENEREEQKKEAVYQEVAKAWNFNAQPQNAISQSLVSSWSQWRALLNELSQKPQSSIGAFRTKAKTLSAKSEELAANIPVQFNKPEVKSRLSVLSTKINALDLYMNLDKIPAAKVSSTIQEINDELRSVQMQLDEIVRKSKIPKEAGESDLIRMRDTARAIPTTPKEILLPQ